MAAEQYIGDGRGYIYVTENVSSPTNTDIIASVKNTCENVRNIIYPLALSSAGLYANKSATGSILVNSVAGAGSITAITINSVNQISGTISVLGKTEEDVAFEIAEAINAYTPSVGADFTAVAIGSLVTIIAPQSTGTTYNNRTVATSSTDPGNIDLITEPVNGGTDSNELVDICGYKFFINPDFDSEQCAGTVAAQEGKLTNSVEITNAIIFQGLQGSLKEESVQAVSDQIVPTRISAIQNVIIESEVGLTDDIETISVEGFSDNDIIYVRVAESQTITFKSGGNLLLEGSNEFVADELDTLVLRKLGSRWYEVSRSKARLGDNSDYRAAGFPFAIQGSTTSALPTAGGFNIEPNVSTVIQRYTGNVILTGNLAFTFAPNGNDGDEIWLFMDGTIDKNGNRLTVNGQDISDKEAETGGWVARAKYNGTSWDHFVTYRLGDTTTWKLDVKNRIESGAITLDKIESSIRTELVTVPVSFDTAEKGDMKFVIPYNCSVSSITAYVSKLIEATEDATIIPKDDASLVMTDGTITLVAGSGIGTGVTSTPIANNTFTAGQVMTLETLKTTDGGKAIVSITLVRS